MSQGRSHVGSRLLLVGLSKTRFQCVLAFLLHQKPQNPLFSLNTAKMFNLISWILWIIYGRLFFYLDHLTKMSDCSPLTPFYTSPFVLICNNSQLHSSNSNSQKDSFKNLFDILGTCIRFVNADRSPWILSSKKSKVSYAMPTLTVWFLIKTTHMPPESCYCLSDLSVLIRSFITRDPSTQRRCWSLVIQNFGAATHSRLVPILT